MGGKSQTCAVCDPEEQHPDTDFCGGCNEATRYVVWCFIEQVLEDSDLYEEYKEVEGTTRSLKRFNSLAEAHSYQNSLVKEGRVED